MIGLADYKKAHYTIAVEICVSADILKDISVIIRKDIPSQ